MIDINYFEQLDGLGLAPNIYSLHKVIKKLPDVIIVSGEPLRKLININTTVIEVSKLMKGIHHFDEEYKTRKEVSPLWETTLSLWINEIENYYLGENYTPYEEDYNNPYPNFPLIYAIYNDIKKGKNNSLYSYADLLIETDSVSKEKYVRIEKFKEISLAVAISYKLPSLKDELRLLNDFSTGLPTNRSSEVKKLKWKGTVSQFGLIFDLLIQGGYLEKPTSSYVKDAPRYLELFEIDTTLSSLVKELSEQTNSLSATNRKKFLIPQIDKLG